MNRILAAALLWSVSSAALADELALGWLALEGDGRNAEQRSYAGIPVRSAKSPREGAETALAESAPLFRRSGIVLHLEDATRPDLDTLIEAVHEQKQSGIRLFLADLPDQVLADLASRLKQEPIFLFNISATADALRGASCQANLFHVMPSRAMLSDALAQALAARNWRRVLAIKGPEPADDLLLSSFARSAQRFGLNIVARRELAGGHDPRRREQNNPALVTAGESFDVAFIADEQGDLARAVAFRIGSPRPVVGSTGLIASAWHWSWERHGAPQLSERFRRRTARQMSAEEWAAWAAAKMIALATVKAGSTDADAIVTALRPMRLDTYKGGVGSFRSWDNQLRQPILLHTADAVVDRAPLPGFLHERDLLDTLGEDEPETRCRFSPGQR